MELIGIFISGFPKNTHIDDIITGSGLGISQSVSELVIIEWQCLQVLLGGHVRLELKEFCSVTSQCMNSQYTDHRGKLLSNLYLVKAYTIRLIYLYPGRFFNLSEIAIDTGLWLSVFSVGLGWDPHHNPTERIGSQASYTIGTLNVCPAISISL